LIVRQVRTFRSPAGDVVVPRMLQTDGMSDFMDQSIEARISGRWRRVCGGIF
jgi:hypothetical protein